jgi:hypothetical protein
VAVDFNIDWLINSINLTERMSRQEARLCASSTARLTCLRDADGHREEVPGGRCCQPPANSVNASRSRLAIEESQDDER